LENTKEIIPKVKLYDLKGENIQSTPISLINTFTNESKEFVTIPNIVYTQLIFSLPEVKLSISENLEDHPFYLASPLITSPFYSSSRFERPSSISHFPADFDFTSFS